MVPKQEVVAAVKKQSAASNSRAARQSKFRKQASSQANSTELADRASAGRNLRSVPAGQAVQNQQTKESPVIRPRSKETG